jgi:hypothetical protein
MDPTRYSLPQRIFAKAADKLKGAFGKTPKALSEPSAPPTPPAKVKEPSYGGWGKRGWAGDASEDDFNALVVDIEKILKSKHSPMEIVHYNKNRLEVVWMNHREKGSDYHAAYSATLDGWGYFRLCPNENLAGESFEVKDIISGLTATPGGVRPPKVERGVNGLDSRSYCGDAKKIAKIINSSASWW